MYYLFIFGKFLSLIFSRKICYIIARCLALLQFLISPKDREAVTYNLSPVVKENKKIDRFVKEVFINFSYYLVDFFRYSKLDKNFIEKYVKIEGLFHLEKALSKKRGVITLTAHLGNYELGGAVASLLGYPIYAVALPHRDKRLNRLFNRHREMVGMKVIHTGISIRQCLYVLKEGKVVAFLGDRDFFKNGIKVRMFSRYALLPRGPAYLALKTGACILPSFFIRKNKYYYVLIFERPIDCIEENLFSEEEIIKRYTKFLENYIEKYLQQWYMFEKYWLKE
jgi:KDO2-lipid IV(A) lauroyltransferase